MQRPKRDQLKVLAVEKANAQLVRALSRQLQITAKLIEAIQPDLERFPSLCPLFGDVVISEYTTNDVPACTVASPPDPFPLLDVGDNVLRNCTSAEWVEVTILEKSLPAVDAAKSSFEPGTATLRFAAFAQARSLFILPEHERSGVKEIQYKLKWKFSSQNAPSGPTGGGPTMRIQDP